MPNIYEKGEIQFMYPEGWEVGDEEALQWPRTVTVRRAGGAFWALHVYPGATRPVQLVEETLRALNEEYDEIESEPVTEEVGRSEAVGANLHFYCLDFIVRAQVRSFTHDDRTYLILSQAEDRDFDELEMVFQAMTVSLLQSRRTS